jgi:hypothetical protein
LLVGVVEEVAVEVEVAAAAAVEVLAQLVAAVGAAAEAPGRRPPRRPPVSPNPRKKKYYHHHCYYYYYYSTALPSRSCFLWLPFPAKPSVTSSSLPAVPEGVVVFEASLRILFEVERRSRTRRRHPSTL